MEEPRIYIIDYSEESKGNYKLVRVDNPEDLFLRKETVVFQGSENQVNWFLSACKDLNRVEYDLIQGLEDGSVRKGTRGITTPPVDMCTTGGVVIKNLTIDFSSLFNLT